MSALPFIIAGLVVLDQALWTFRYQLIVRGSRRMGSALGVLNAVVNVTAVAQVVTNLNQPANIIGYAAGVGIGTYLGSIAESRLGTGYAEVRLVTRTDGVALVESLRSLGWPATASAVAGIGGAGTQIFIIVDRSQVSVLTNHIESLHLDAIVSVCHLADVRAVALPMGFRQVTARTR